MRATEPACPFCASAIAVDAAAGIVPEPAQRLSRAGVLAFAAAFLSTACQPQSGSTTPDPTPSAADAGMMQTIYGGPPPVPAPPTPVPTPSPNDMAVPAYGGPPPTPPAPPAVRPTPSHHSSHPVPAPVYGATPVPARPPLDPGSMSTRYGAPPRPGDDL